MTARNNNSTDHIVGEFTLEDTYDHLKEVEKELHEQMDELMNICTNNQIETISIESTPEEMQLKHDRMLLGLLNNSYDYDSRIRPMANTVDLYKLTNWELEQEISNIQDIIDSLKENLATTKNNISYLENEINGLERMREVCTDAIENVANTAYDAEMTVAKKLFASVKRDLASVVEILLPGHEEFGNLMVKLAQAHSKGGDDMYIDFKPELYDCIEFLIESDIIMRHRNDKNKVRLMDLV